MIQSLLWPSTEQDWPFSCSRGQESQELRICWTWEKSASEECLVATSSLTCHHSTFSRLPVDFVTDSFDSYISISDLYLI